MTPEERRFAGEKIAWDKAKAQAKPSAPKPSNPQPPAETPTEKATREQREVDATRPNIQLPKPSPGVLPAGTVGGDMYGAMSTMWNDSDPGWQAWQKDWRNRMAESRAQTAGTTAADMFDPTGFNEEAITEYNRRLQERSGKEQNKVYYDQLVGQYLPGQGPAPAENKPAPAGPVAPGSPTVVKPIVEKNMVNGDQEQRTPMTAEKIEKLAKGRNPLQALLEALQAGMVGFSGANIPLAYKERMAREDADMERTEAEKIRAEEKYMRQSERQADQENQVKLMLMQQGFQGTQADLDRQAQKYIASLRSAPGASAPANPQQALASVSGKLGL